MSSSRHPNQAKVSVHRILDVIQSIQGNLMTLNAMLNQSQESENSVMNNPVNQAAFLRLIVKIGEQIKYLKPDQPQTITQGNNDAQDFYKLIFGSAFEAAAEPIKRLRDKIAHDYVIAKHLYQLYPLIPQYVASLKFNIPLLYEKLTQAISCINYYNQQQAVCGYEAGMPWSTDKKINHGPADFLAFTMREIKELIVVLKRCGVDKTISSASFDTAVNGDPNFLPAVEYHVINIAQLFKEYEFFFQKQVRGIDGKLHNNNFFDTGFTDIDNFYHLAESSVGEFKRARNDLAHLNDNAIQQQPNMSSSSSSSPATSNNNRDNLLQSLLSNELPNIIYYVDAMLKAIQENKVSLEEDGVFISKSSSYQPFNWESTIDNFTDRQSHSSAYDYIWDSAVIPDNNGTQETTMIDNNASKNESFADSIITTVTSENSSSVSSSHKRVWDGAANQVNSVNAQASGNELRADSRIIADISGNYSSTNSSNKRAKIDLSNEIALNLASTSSSSQYAGPLTGTPSNSNSLFSSTALATAPIQGPSLSAPGPDLSSENLIASTSNNTSQTIPENIQPSGGLATNRQPISFSLNNPSSTMARINSRLGIISQAATHTAPSSSISTKTVFSIATARSSLPVSTASVVGTLDNNQQQSNQSAENTEPSASKSPGMNHQ